MTKSEGGRALLNGASDNFPATSSGSGVKRLTGLGYFQDLPKHQQKVLWICRMHHLERDLV